MAMFEFLLFMDSLSTGCRGGLTRSRDLYIFIGKSLFQDNFIATIVHLKVYVFLNLTAWRSPANPADLAGNKARV